MSAQFCSGVFCVPLILCKEECGEWKQSIYIAPFKVFRFPFTHWVALSPVCQGGLGPKQLKSLLFFFAGVTGNL